MAHIFARSVRNEFPCADPGLAEVRRVFGSEGEGNLELGFKDNHAVVRRGTTMLNLRGRCC